MTTKNYSGWFTLVTVLLLGSQLFARDVALVPVVDACAAAPYEVAMVPPSYYQLFILEGQNEERCTMQFSAALIPAGQKINSATIVLNCYGSGGAPTVVANGYTGTGAIVVPGNFTVTNPIAGPISTAQDGCPFSKPQDVTAFVKIIYGAQGNYVGITLTVTKDNSVQRYLSRNSDMAAPTLVVRYSKAGEAEE